ncbi:MAG: transketolase-like TK C-terminal-containing protein, partial [Ilumatobacteraceae bacterium]
GSAVATGAGIVGQDVADPAIILIGTGAEVAVCVEAAETLSERGLAARVVSMPSWDRFALQPRESRDAILPPGVPRLSVEAASTFGWERWSDAQVGIDRFGASAPGAEVLERLGIAATHVVASALELIAEGGR